MPTKGINGSWLYIRHLWSLRPPTSFSGSFLLETRLTIRDTKNWPRQTFQIWTPASVTLRVPSLLLLSVFTRLLPPPHYPARPVRLGSCGLSNACLGYVTEMHWSWRPGKKLYRDKAMSSHHRIFTWAITVNDLINARGIYLILEVQADERRLKQREAFILITTTSTTKLVRFRQKNQESLKIAEYPPHQSIRLGHLIIHIAFSNSNIDVRISLRVIVLPSVVYPYFELDIMQTLVYQARNWRNWMILLLFANS